MLLPAMTMTLPPATLMLAVLPLNMNLVSDTRLQAPRSSTLHTRDSSLQRSAWPLVFGRSFQVFSGWHRGDTMVAGDSFASVDSPASSKGTSGQATRKRRPGFEPQALT